MTTPDGMTELLLMLLADARLPVAGHTQSAGLEPAIAAGLRAEQVPDYMAARLATVTRVEAATAVVAMHQLRLGTPQPDGAPLKLTDVEDAWAARTPSLAMRQTSRLQARALLRLVTRLWPDTVSLVGRSVPEGRPSPPRAVVIAIAAMRCGLSPHSVARLIGYDDLQTVASAALKLVPMDPLTATSWVFDALPAVEALATEVGALTEPRDLPVAGAPQIEAWAEAHAKATRRLFSA